MKWEDDNDDDYIVEEEIDGPETLPKVSVKHSTEEFYKQHQPKVLLA